MRNKALISIIVPIYNVEKYLAKCIDSIIANTYTNIEVILVDDGSPDRCGKICDEYAQMDNRIKVLHKKNEGLSSARNAGMKMSTGDYIFFIDSDDTVTKNMFEVMIQYAKEYDADVVQCGYHRINEDGSIRSTEASDFSVLEGHDSIYRAFFEDWKITIPAQLKLYKKNIIKNKCFVEGRLHEDVMFISDILCDINKYIIIPDVCYMYLLRSGSIMRSRFSQKKMDILYAHQYAMERYKKYAEGYVENYELQICLTCFYLYHSVYVSKGDTKYYSTIKDEWNKYKDNVMPKLRKLTKSKTVYIELFLFNLNKKMAVALYNIYKKLGFGKV